MSSDSCLYPIENRGYGRSVGSLILPNGTQLQVSDETPEFNNILTRLVYECWEAHLVR
jgi:hypothetical protein